ncbi:MAG: YqgE/AlgH family protein [Maricaulaceae bacterium]|nr:YqgE/AlgH family protein [Maricaulaceae bacterium]
MARSGYLTGKLLIASPAIGDPRFDRTVIFVCDHTEEHAMGLIINRPLRGLRMPALFEQLGVECAIHVPDRPVLDGGPVDRDRGFVLHTKEFDAEDSTLSVAKGIGLTATKEVLAAIASDQAPRKSLLALGYAGWGAGQLDDELSANAWLVADADEALIFDDQLDDKWARALNSLGVSPARLSAQSGHA